MNEGTNERAKGLTDGRTGGRTKRTSGQEIEWTNRRTKEQANESTTKKKTTELTDGQTRNACTRERNNTVNFFLLLCIKNTYI